tara:strand:- start:4 stop:525 length:522 start_codon:yes stop_codon:yes gene_type:complete
MSETEQFIHICDLTTKILKLPKDSLSLQLRDRPIALGREIAGVIGLKNGIHRKVVSKILKKHRTATYHYERNHNRWFTYYAPYRNGYLKVMKAYQNIEDNKKQFIDKNHLKFFIKDKLGLKNSKKPEVLVTINSGNLNYLLLSDCFRFSKDLKILKKALKEYKHKITYETYER